MTKSVEAGVVTDPEAVAAVFEGDSLTYRRLDSGADQLAHRLRALGVGPDVLVGLCVERSLDMVVALLGILKAGGAYVPFDVAYPRERIETALADAWERQLPAGRVVLRLVSATCPMAWTHPAFTDPWSAAWKFALPKSCAS